MDFVIDLEKIDRGDVDDRTLRGVISYGCARDLAIRDRAPVETQTERRKEFAAMLRSSPLAVATEAANEQHYEAPSAFFETVLGPHLKYSCCYFEDAADELAGAEAAMLRLICERADLHNGQDILDLGCGWGAISLYLAERFPKSRITGLSNSRTQKAFIDGEAKTRGLSNLTIVTADLREHEFPAGSFDRIVTIEMMEHMRNYELLLGKVAGWMRLNARMFIHIFTHRRHSYVFENNWIADHFFTGGMMPADDLLWEFQRDLEIADHWFLEGSHYQKTADLWLANLDANRDRVLEIFEEHYGTSSRKMFQMWRLFFLTTAESFGFRNGQEWGVSHYVLRRR